MSRLSIKWIFFWIVLLALGVTVWRALKGADEPVAPLPSKVERNVSSKVNPRSSVEVPDSPNIDNSLKEDGLLKTLPVPQSPPAKLNASAKKKWQEDLMALIDNAAYLDDEASLRMLIVEFRNPDPGIAAAARESLLSRADKKALPYLLEMQELNLKSDQARQLEEMIEFLGKQSVFEHMRSKDL